jgi:hypothetical protein
MAKIKTVDSKGQIKVSSASRQYLRADGKIVKTHLTDRASLAALSIQ